LRSVIFWGLFDMQSLDMLDEQSTVLRIDMIQPSLFRSPL
jgi:hypothetical protein